MNSLIVENQNNKAIDDGTRSLIFVPFQKFQKFQTVYSQGSLVKRLFIVRGGAVKLVQTLESGDQLIKEIKTEGEIFGEWRIMFNSGLYNNYSAVAIADNTNIHALSLSDLNSVRIPQVISDFLEMILAQNERLESRHKRLLYKDAGFRVRETLRDLALRAGQKFGEETLIKAWLSHHDIAKLADTSRQSVSTVMSSLKKSGKIKYSRNRILFKNLDNIHR